MKDGLYFYIIRYRQDMVMIQIPMTASGTACIYYKNYEQETLGL